MKFLKRKYTAKQALVYVINSVWYRWRLWQHKRSRWFIFWTLREIREHYRLWRIRPEIMTKPRSLMVKGQQIYYYRIGTFGQAQLVAITDDDSGPPPGPSPLFRHWSQFEEHLFNRDVDHTARKLGYER